LIATRAPLRLNDRMIAYLLILPAILYVFVFAFLPSVQTIFGSFFLASGKFSLYNYQFVTSSFGYSPIVNTFEVTVIALTVQFIAAFLIASLLSKPFRGRAVFSAIFLIPFGVATIVTAVIFHNMFSTFGGYMNSFLVSIGLKPINWTGGFWPPLIALILADSWKNTPIVTLVLLSGMVSIPSDLYSQAMVDGAGAFRRFFYITLPNLAGFIAIALMIRGISEFNIFAMALLIFNRQLLTTMTFSLYDTINPHPAYAGAAILLGIVLIFATLIMLYRSRYVRVV